MADSGAYVLRETTGTTDLDETVRRAVEELADHDIPHLIAGGLAVQEHGYYRVTTAVDIVVPDVVEALEMAGGTRRQLNNRRASQARVNDH